MYVDDERRRQEEFYDDAIIQSARISWLNSVEIDPWPTDTRPWLRIRSPFYLEYDQ